MGYTPVPTPPGAVTQLVECLLCKQKVEGSNPFSSTNTIEYAAQTMVHLWTVAYRNRLCGMVLLVRL